MSDIVDEFTNIPPCPSIIGGGLSNEEVIEIAEVLRPAWWLKYGAEFRRRQDIEYKIKKEQEDRYKNTGDDLSFYIPLKEDW